MDFGIRNSTVSMNFKIKEIILRNFVDYEKNRKNNK